jgi:hypothetical protein
MMHKRERKLGSNRCQCASCGEYFNSTAAFGKHRTGEYGTDRRCRTPFEMTEAGMVVSQRGWWVTSAREMQQEGAPYTQISAPETPQATSA